MSTSELSGSWRYRIFNPPFFNPTFAGTLTEKESNLFLADAVLKLKSSAQAGNPSRSLQSV